MMSANTQSIEELIKRREELLKKRKSVLSRQIQPGTRFNNDTEVFPKPSTSGANQTTLLESNTTTWEGTIEKDFSDFLSDDSVADPDFVLPIDELVGNIQSPTMQPPVKEPSLLHLEDIDSFPERTIEDLFPMVTPASKNCSVIYASITSKWELRRDIFKFIKASSASKGMISTISRASMVLLSGAELGTFNLTNRHIVIENPILLCWAELAKYSVHLIAAIDKYQKLGEDAPYCKLLYPSNQLPEFNRKGLRILATIAREIAILEGQDTLKNYAGTERTSDTKLLVDRALFLVKAAGGANTLTTQAVRDGYFAPTRDNAPLYEDLKFGAYVDTVEDIPEEEEENLAIQDD